MNELELLDNQSRVTSIHSHDGVKYFVARLLSSSACCSECGPSCHRRHSFAERLPWALSHSRRTLRMERMLSTLMLAMSAKEAERVMAVLGFRISHDTLLRVL